MGTKERNALARFEAAVREHAWRGSKPVEEMPEIDKAYIKAKKEMEALIARVDKVIQGPPAEPVVDKAQPVIDAAIDVCASITESDLDDMVATYTGTPGTGQTNIIKFHTAMTDLGMAVQDYTNNGR